MGKTFGHLDEKRDHYQYKDKKTHDRSSLPKALQKGDFEGISKPSSAKIWLFSSEPVVKTAVENKVRGVTWGSKAANSKNGHPQDIPNNPWIPELGGHWTQNKEKEKAAEEEKRKKEAEEKWSDDEETEPMEEDTQTQTQTSKKKKTKKTNQSKKIQSTQTTQTQSKSKKSNSEKPSIQEESPKEEKDVETFSENNISTKSTMYKRRDVRQESLLHEGDF